MTAAKVLTTGSTMKCPHGFAITFKSAATLRVDGKPVVRSSDLLQTVFACTSQTPCKTIPTFATSATVRDGASPVVVVTGIATNIGPCTDVDAAHDLLQAE